MLYDGTIGAEHFGAVGIPNDVWVARCAHLSSGGGLDESMVSAGSSGGGLDESMASASSSVAAADVSGMSLDTSTSRNSPRKKKLRTGLSMRQGASTRVPRTRSTRKCTK